MFFEKRLSFIKEVNVSKKEEKKEELIQKIKEKEQQIEMFRKRMKTSDLCADLYDKALVEKAVLKKELEELEKSKLLRLVNKFVPKDKKNKLICDYFKE